jgi:cytochrome c-type biogenesis protein CcmE
MQNSTIGKIVLTAVVAVAGVGFFVKSTLDHREDYFKVEKLMAEDLGDWTGKEIRVHGFVRAGSIKEDVVNQQTVRTFILQSEGKTIRVFSKGPKPDTFKDQSEVVATGRLVPAAERRAAAAELKINIESDAAYVVDATDLQAKCPSKYEGAQSNKKLDTDYK